MMLGCLVGHLQEVMSQRRGVKQGKYQRGERRMRQYVKRRFLFSAIQKMIVA